ncbi:hypothetical protein D1872_307360 [compost metagenome]
MIRSEQASAYVRNDKTDKTDHPRIRYHRSGNQGGGHQIQFAITAQVDTESYGGFIAKQHRIQDPVLKKKHCAAQQNDHGHDRRFLPTGRSETPHRPKSNGFDPFRVVGKINNQTRK